MLREQGYNQHVIFGEKQYAAYATSAKKATSAAETNSHRAARRDYRGGVGVGCVNVRRDENVVC